MSLVQESGRAALEERRLQERARESFDTGPNLVERNVASPRVPESPFDDIGLVRPRTRDPLGTGRLEDCLVGKVLDTHGPGVAL